MKYATTDTPYAPGDASMVCLHRHPTYPTSPALRTPSAPTLTAPVANPTAKSSHEPPPALPTPKPVQPTPSTPEPKQPTPVPQPAPAKAPSQSTALALAKPTKAPPPATLSHLSSSSADLTVNVQLPTLIPQPPIQIHNMAHDDHTTALAISTPTPHPMAAPPDQTQVHHDLADHLNQLAQVNDDWWADNHQLMDSVMDHLFHWFDHVRNSPVPTSYLREAIYYVHPNYLSGLGPNPLPVHTQLLQDVRYALNTMLNHLNQGQPWHIAANTGPRSDITNQGRPMYLVDPNLLLQIAHECHRQYPNAPMHRLPTNMTLRRLQQYYGLREPVVPNVPAVKAPPMQMVKALPPKLQPAIKPPPAPAPAAPCPQHAPQPHPAMPWPAPWTPTPCPPAPHNAAPPAHAQHPDQQPLVKVSTETTTVTTTTTRYYAPGSSNVVYDV